MLFDSRFVNQALEIFALVIMLILYICCMLKKKRTATTKPLAYIIVAECFLLLCQIIEWHMTGIEVYRHIYKFFFVADYILAYIVYCCIHNYNITFVDECLRNAGRKDRLPKWLRYISVPWGILASGLFISSLWTGVFYTFDQTGKEVLMPLYDVVLLVAVVIIIFDIIIFIPKMKIVGVKNVIILFLYLLVPLAVAPIDLKYELCLSYLAVVIIVFIIYIDIDVNLGEFYLEQEKELIDKKRELEEKKTQIVLSQIQPHFMFNALTVISGLCDEDVHMAKKAIDSFSLYLRMNMESLESSKLVPFSKELEHTMTYLWIEQMRFGEDLKVEYDIQFEDFLIPPLTLQPIAENAVRHGICNTEDGGTVVIATRADDKYVCITVQDDGAGFDPSQIGNDGKIHIGTQNVRVRVDLLCHGQLHLESEIGKGTLATIVIPRGGKHENLISR